jgi:hypothetical protein
LRRKIDGHAEGLKHVCGSAAGGDGAIAMLGYLGACSRGHQRCAGRYVEGERSSAAGAHDIDELGPFLRVERDGRGALAHDLNEAGQFRDLLSARGQDGDQCGDLDVGNRTGENLGERVRGLLAGERGAVFGERLEEFLQQGHIPIW